MQMMIDGDKVIHMWYALWFLRRQLNSVIDGSYWLRINETRVDIQVAQVKLREIINPSV